MIEAEYQKSPCLPGKTIRNRMDCLYGLVKKGDIMDLGVVDSWRSKMDSREPIERNPHLLFRQIAEINPNVLGIDLDDVGIAALRHKGYNAQCANVETMTLDRRFDVIVAGDIIEHLENPGLFLRNAHRHLKPTGILALSTPNPFYAKQRYKIWRYGNPEVHDEHTCWFDPITLSLLLRKTGFEPFEAYWVQPERNILKTWIRFLRAYYSHSFLILARPVPAD